MSHAITLRADGALIEFSAGTGWRTFAAMRSTGFALYEAYEAAHCDGGMSGAGESVEVPLAVARAAYVSAIAWALALECVAPAELRDPASLEFGPMRALDARPRPGQRLGELRLPYWRAQEFGPPEADALSDPEQAYYFEMVPLLPARIAEATNDADLDVARAQSAARSAELAGEELDGDTWHRALGAVAMTLEFAAAVRRAAERGGASINFA